MYDTPKWSLEDAVEIKFDNEENFSKIVESLTRIGRVGENKTLNQTANILHKRGRYYIIHFKGMFALDGNYDFDYDVEDIAEQNKIVKLLESWNLCEIVDKFKANSTDDVFVKVVRHNEKQQWNLVPQYKFGEK